MLSRNKNVAILCSHSKFKLVQWCRHKSRCEHQLANLEARAGICLQCKWWPINWQKLAVIFWQYIHFSKQWNCWIIHENCKTTHSRSPTKMCFAFCSEPSQFLSHYIWQKLNLPSWRKRKPESVWLPTTVPHLGARTLIAFCQIQQVGIFKADTKPMEGQLRLDKLWHHRINSQC